MLLMKIMNDSHRYKYLLLKNVSWRKNHHWYLLEASVRDQPPPPPKKRQTMVTILQNKFYHNKQKMFMSQLMQMYLMRKKYSFIFQIQTLSIMVNHFYIQRLWIILNKMSLLIQSTQRLFHYQVTVIQINDIHIALHVRKTWRSNIFQMFIMKIESTNVFHHFHGINMFWVELKHEYCKDDELD